MQVIFGNLDSIISLCQAVRDGDAAQQAAGGIVTWGMGPAWGQPGLQRRNVLGIGRLASPMHHKTARSDNTQGASTGRHDTEGLGNLCSSGDPQPSTVCRVPRASLTGWKQ
jgi:hypothetical protein